MLASRASRLSRSLRARDRFAACPALAFLVLAFSVAACAGGGAASSFTGDSGPPSSDDAGASADSGEASSSDGSFADSGLDAAADAAGQGLADGGADAGVDASEAGGGDSGPPGLYASPTGSGTSCTLASPCALAAAVVAARGQLAAMKSDLAVYLRGGTYPLTTTLALGPADSGQNGYQVVYQAFPGEIPVLSGAVPVTGFTQYNAATNVWRAALPPEAAGATGRQLFVNGVRAVRARSAGSPDAVTTTATGFDTSDGVYASYGNPSRIEVVQDNDWKQMRCPLQSISALADGGASLNVLPNCWAANNLAVPNVGFPFNGSGLPGMSGISWVENAYELLTQPGQFYLDTGAGYLYYMPRASEALATADVELPVLETLVSLSGTPGHLAPQNDNDLAATYVGTWSPSTGRGYGDLDNDVHYTQTTGDSVTFSFTGTGIEILGETFTNEGTFQVYLDGTLDTNAFTEANTPPNTSRLAQQVIYSVLGLSNAAHKVGIVSGATGGQFTVIDGFVVLPAAIAPVHDVTFSGITFSYTTWNDPSTIGYIDNQAGVLWSTSGTTPTPTRIPAAVQVHRGLNVSFTGNTFSHLGSTALDLADGTQNSSVTGSIIEDTSGGGISIGEVDDYFQTQPSLMTSGDTISDNAIAHVGVDYHDAVGIWAGYTQSLTIDYNDIGHTPYSGMSVGWGWGWASPCSMQLAEPLPACIYGTIYAGGNQILFNYVHDVMGYLHDGGPIYTNGGQASGEVDTPGVSAAPSLTSVLANNFVTAGNGTNNMLYQDEGSSYWDTRYNVTSLGGADWIGMWTPTIHDITVGPTNYTDNPNTLNNGTSISYTAPTVVSGGTWPSLAASIMAGAGLEPAYRPAQAIVDDDDQSLSYVGFWGAQGFRGFGDYEDNVHYTLTNGNSVSLTFTGTGVSFISELSSDQGQISWSLDGDTPIVVDTSLPAGSARQAQQVILSSATLAAGKHVLQITKNSGTYMTVDAFRVLP